MPWPGRQIISDTEPRLFFVFADFIRNGARPGLTPPRARQSKAWPITSICPEMGQRPPWSVRSMDGFPWPPGRDPLVEGGGLP